MRAEECNVIPGLLLSLNAIDANLDLRAGDLNEVCACYMARFGAPCAVLFSFRPSPLVLRA